MFIASKKTFAIVYKDKVIGSIGIEEYCEKELPKFTDKKGRELGYVLSKDYLEKGIMTEAVKAIIEYCFSELKMEFLVCDHFLDNEHSKRVQEKCGFKHLKLIKYETRYGIVKDCWLSILENKSYETID